MDTRTPRLSLLCAALACSLLVCGCAHVEAARNVGGAEARVWVYIESSDDDNNGVYRCLEVPDQPPVCVRASLHKGARNR